jgi:tetratricopeptide (TPR) repeat protein
MSVVAKIEPRVIPTYPVGVPEKNPVFFEKRVYQGSNGKVYPVPFIDKVFDVPQDVTYQSARLENEFVRLVMLPEIGGRIFIGQDKTNADYDFFYRQDVIKPALVGLAGPWISGGVEFNWPQHHRPGTFMPADVFIEKEDDGARTVWMSEHDPLNRLKGMHGIRLRPGSSLIELRARLYNRTPFTQTFLWWANVAAMVHNQYQSFFPPDVTYVADHAVRAMSSFPIAENPYYGVDYQNLPGTNDLSWYKNIPVPTSYMVCQTRFDFFGGYDFKAGGGFVHVANRHIAPGKKQWTWGDHEFGHAWDRELTDTNGPYIELMAGVYTDNQPDFSYLAPYETKTFSQYWWPIQGIGPVQQANERIALRMVVRDDRMIELGVCVSEKIHGALISIRQGNRLLLESKISLKPGESWKHTELRFSGENPCELAATIRDADGEILLVYRPVDTSPAIREREVATEPPAPADITSADELYFTGEHLELYRHPTRSPEIYWKEALARDPGDARCNIGTGRRALKQGRWSDAEENFRKAIARLTRRHPNPETGEAHFFLGLALVFQGRHETAYPVFYKATWNHAWRSSAYYQLACLDCRRRDFETAMGHLEESLATNSDHTKAMVLQALIAHRLSDDGNAEEIIADVLELDPLDHWAAVAADCIRHGKINIPKNSRNDAQTILDIAFDFIEAGFNTEAIALLDAHHKSPIAPVAVPNPLERTAMTHYLRAWLTRAPADLAEARRQSPDYFFPSRPHEQLVLEWAVAGASGSCSSISGASGSVPNGKPDLKTPDTRRQEPEAPATFIPTFLHPDKPIDRYKINLPHWRQEGATYAITFRLADSLPKSVIDEYMTEKQRLYSMLEKAIADGDETMARNCDERLRELYSSRVESALDAGHGACLMNDPEIARIVADAIRHFDGDRYELAAWCLMPNHVHLIIKPRAGHQLGDIIRGIKTFSANQANKLLSRTGAFWMEEYYDHIIRDMDDFHNQLAYLKRNPAKLRNWPWLGWRKVAGASGSCSSVSGASGSVPNGKPDLKTPHTRRQEPEAPATDPVAAYALGNYYYDLKRHEDAIALWQRAADDGAGFATLHRNLGIALWNVRHDGGAARACYLKALDLEGTDPRLVSEYDQLRAKLNDPLADRLAFLERHRELVLQRDDCTVALASLYNLTGKPDQALALVTSRRFHPWEGGEGAVLRQFTTAHLLLGRKALEGGDTSAALDHFTGAMQTPGSLGEAYHLLQAKADVNYWIGRALKQLGRLAEARNHFKQSAEESGDFSEMAVTAHSPLTYYRGLSLRELGREDQAKAVFEDLRAYATAKLGETAAIDYFATSLPNLLVFEEDLQARRDAENHLLIALACHGLGDPEAAQSHLAQTLAFTNSDQRAADLAADLLNHASLTRMTMDGK